ncbi:hypothetical protein [Streptomyces sp. S1]|uniref:hypothetical protein n=1 Tax=Streptomyces sp. S1 TaxID=718288 RepID=UPI003D724B4C
MTDSIPQRAIASQQQRDREEIQRSAEALATSWASLASKIQRGAGPISGDVFRLNEKGLALLRAAARYDGAHDAADALLPWGWNESAPES